VMVDEGVQNEQAGKTALFHLSFLMNAANV
jgi:hypothetical protein